MFQEKESSITMFIFCNIDDCRGNLTADARGWLIVDGAMRTSSGSGSESEHELGSTRDVTRFGALRRDNTLSPTEMTMIKSIQSCS